MSTDAVESKLDTLSQRVARLEAEVAEGATPDLTGLDAAIGEACDAVAALPPSQAEALRPLLDELLDGLAALDHTLRSRFEGVKSELQEHGKRSQAVKAYGQTAGRGRRPS